MSYLDSHDLQARLEEIEDSLGINAPFGALDSLGLTREEAQAEVEELRTLANEVTDWEYGATLIPVNDFEEYARELADDIGAIPEGTSWPLTCIDWERAANDLAMDYSEVSYQGTDYYVRD